MRPSLLRLTTCCLLLVACDKNKGASTNGQIDCDTEIEYQGRQVETSVNAGKFGAKVDTSMDAVRQIDQVVERYLARWKSMCREYNAGVYDRDQYRQESAKMREQMEKLDALLIQLSNAPDPESYQAALAGIYREMVPDEERRDLEMSLGILAMRPGEAAASPVASGASLPTGTKVYFSLRPSKAAHVYLYQESPSGQLSVLFPIPQIAARNPLPGGTELRIPPDPGSFTLNAEDIGTETVHIVASLDPIPALDATLGKPQASVAEAKCNSRGLEFDAGKPDACSGSRGLEFDAGGGAAGPAPSLAAVTAPGDTRIVQSFTFEHTTK